MNEMKKILFCDNSLKEQLNFRGDVINNYAADGFEKLSDGGSVSAGVSIPLDGIMPWSSSAQGIDSAKENIRLLELKLEDQKTTVRIKADSLIKKINY